MDIKILVVDDNDDFRHIAKTFLHKADTSFVIETVEGAREALIALENKHYDAIVSDYQMPIMNGLELLESIRAMGNEIPFVMFTGRSREEVAIKALNLGATQYVKKGGDFKSQFTELAHIVRSAVEHQRASIALLESEARYRLLAENASDIIFTINLDLKLTYVSPSVEKVLGWKPSEIMNMSTEKIIRFLEFDFTIQEMEEELRKEVSHEEALIDQWGPLQYEIRHKDGSDVIIEMKVGTITGQVGNIMGVMGIVRDVTERVKSTERARISSERYARLLESISDSVYVLNRDYQRVVVNSAAEKFTGIPREELLSKSLMETFPGVENTEFFRVFERVMETRKKETVLDKFIFEDGRVGWFQVDVYPTAEGILCISRDVTERETNKQQIERKIEIEQLINRILSYFLNEETTYQAINRALEDFGKTFHASYAGIRIWNNDELPLDDWYTCSIDGGITIDKIPSIDELSELASEIQKRQVLVVGDVNNLPEHWVDEKSFFESTGIQSFIVLPLFSKSKIHSFIGLAYQYSNPRYIKGETNLIQLVTYTLSEAIERRAVKELLEIQKERYKLLADNSTDIIVLVNKDMNIEFISPSVRRVLGILPDRLPNTSLIDLIHPSMQEATERKIQSLCNDSEGGKESHRFEIAMMTESDEKIWGELAVRILNPGTPNVKVIGEIRDITERRITEEYLRKSEERYRSLIQGFQGIAYRSTPQGQFHFIHGDIEGITGRKQVELVNGNLGLVDLVHPDDREYVKEIGRKCGMIPGYRSKREYRIIKPDGRIRWVQESLSNICSENWEVTQIEGVMIDITTAKIAQKNLRENEQVLRDLFHSIPDPAFLWKHDDDIYYTILVNKAASELLELDEIKAMGMRIEELHKYNPEIIELVKRAFDNDEPIREECAIRFTDNGDEVWSMLAVSKTADGSVLEILTDLTQQRDTEMALRESEEKYRNFVQNFYGIAYRLDTCFNPIFIHGAVEEITGYTSEEIFSMKGEGLHSLLSEEDMIRVAEFWSSILEKTEPQSIIHRIRRKDGVVRWTEHKIQVIRDEQGIPRFLHGTTYDVTDKVKAEMELRESEERHRTIISSMHDMILVYDKENRFVQFYCSEYSPLYGRPELFIGEHAGLTFPTARNGEAISLVEHLRRSGESKVFDFPMDIDGKSYWFSAQLSLHDDGESIVSVVRDMTRRKHIEDALRDNEEKFRRLFHEIPEPSTLWELQDDGEIILAMINNAFLEISSGKMSKLIGASIAEMDGYFPEYISAVKEVMKTGHSKSLQLPIHLDESDNRWYICEFAKTSEDLVLAISTDLTELLEAQKKLIAQKEELSRFAHHMNHDLRNYLHNILGYAILLKDEYEQKHIRGIISSVNKAEKLLSKSVNLADAGLVIGDREEADLDIVIRSIIQSIVPASIKVEIEDMPVVSCDSIKVEQAIANIISNAIEHAEPEEIVIRRKKENGKVCLFFENDGTPIPQEYRDRILQDGFSTREKGRGLGLVIVQKVIDAHGWDISLEDSERTCFKITIPESDIIYYR